MKMGEHLYAMAENPNNLNRVMKDAWKGFIQYHLGLVTNNLETQSNTPLWLEKELKSIQVRLKKQLKVKSVPRIFSPSNPLARASSIASSRNFSVSGYS